MTKLNKTFERKLAAVPYYAVGRPEPVKGELETMRGAMVDLVELLSYARPHNSPAELLFLEEYLLPRFAALGFAIEADGFGNLWGSIPQAADSLAPLVLWSCHIDTVHSPAATRQEVRWADDGRTLELVKRKAGRCLGADDGAGIWLLLRMIEAGVPGGYVFHRGEEVGRLGSIYVSESEPERLADYTACVAFDRRDYTDLITHQMGERCASEAFSDSFAAAINGRSFDLAYSSDDTGSYTDSYSYAGLISECCNMSVGYGSEHGPRETLDALHLWRLAGAMVTADLSAVVCERDCTEVDYGWYYSGGGSGGSRTGDASWQGDYYPDDGFDYERGEALGGEGERLLDMVRRYPKAVVELLGLYGLDCGELAEHLTPSELAGACGAGLLPAAVGGGGWSL